MVEMLAEEEEEGVAAVDSPVWVKGQTQVQVGSESGFNHDVAVL